MKQNVKSMMTLALALCLLLAACGGQEALPSDAPPPEEAPPVQSGFPELEETEWEAVSTDAGDFGITELPIGDPVVYGGASSLSLDQLIAFALASDGAASEDLFDELRQRFLEAPNTVLIYLTLMGEQETSIAGWEPVPTAELICQYIASADAAWHGGSEEFAKTLAACRERYPSGRIAELLDVMEREHAASMERQQEAIEAYQEYLKAQE